MKNIIFLLLVLTGFSVDAQLIKKRFVDEQGSKVQENEAVYVYEYTVHPSINFKYLRAKKRILDGMLLENATLSSLDPEMLDGEFIRYYSDTGTIAEKGTHEKYKKVGIWVSYYKNGALRERINYYFPEELDIQYLVEEAYDSLGNGMTIAGKGVYAEYIGGNKEWNSVDVITGGIVDGLKHGKWIGSITKYKDQYEEEWNMGRLISGIRTDSAGNNVPYSKLAVMASPPGGLSDLYASVSQNIIYPKKARRQGIEGKVFVEFVVDKNGLLIDVRTIKGIGGGCDEEAARVITNSPKWSPGVMRGRSVKQKMVLPIMFKLR